jgi:hypothetical protein
MHVIQAAELYAFDSHFMLKMSGRGVRAAGKMNYPNLLVSGSDFSVASNGEYPDMPRLTRLEFGPISGAI